ILAYPKRSIGCFRHRRGSSRNPAAHSQVPPAAAGFVEPADPGVADVPQNSGVVAPDSPYRWRGESLRFGPRVPVWKTEHAYQTAPVQTDPDRPFPVLQRALHGTDGQAAGLSDGVPSGRSAARQPSNGGDP